MPIEINYDETGKPKTVLLSYDEYQHLVAKPDEVVIVQQTASRICDMIREMVLDPQGSGQNDEQTTDEQALEGDRIPSNTVTGEQAIPVPGDTRRFMNATGYYVADGFRVLKGSRASGQPSSTFMNLEWVMRLREQLIKVGTLVREGDSGDYTFNKDYVFDSPSAAACVVAGNSRSGPASWGRRTL